MIQFNSSGVTGFSFFLKRNEPGKSQPPYSSLDWIYARNRDSSASLSDVKNRPKKISSPAVCIPIENSWYSPECQICLQ
jgi:hypothetical protein